MGNNLKQTIDKMVTDSIRRILPGIMNEVLLKTIAHSGIIAESDDRPVRKVKKGPKRHKVREQRAVQGKRPPRKVELSDILDESAGAEFYQDPRSVARQVQEEDIEDEEDDVPMTSRLNALPPALRGLAEGVSLDDDEGEMWGDEHDSTAVTVGGPEIKDISRAAQVAGVDFSRIKNIMGVVTPTKKIDRDDVKAKAQFDTARIQRMRESLNGGKPIE